VFPPRLRLDRDTEWRVCQYAGSRYRDDAPMNVTALKAIKYWKPKRQNELHLIAVPGSGAPEGADSRGGRIGASRPLYFGGARGATSRRVGSTLDRRFVLTLCMNVIT